MGNNNRERGEKKRVLHVGSYEVGKTLGNGSFGKVKLGTNVFTKEKVAIKFFNHRKFANMQQVASTHKEIEIMKLLSHPNIVKLIDVIENTEENTTFLIAEYVSGGELFDYIVANGTVKERQARHFLRQIVSAVEFCHANLVVHRDLKPENLLLDANGNIKISDFGLSNMIEPGKLLDSFCGSPLYAAPEILLAEKYVGPPIDVWSIGVILFALLCGHLPWNGESQAEISHNSIKGIYDEPHELSATGRDLIRKMLNPNPKARITIAEIRKHAWINEGYNEPPSSLLTVRQPVLEVRDDIIAHLMTLGFKNEQEIRKLILDNECCQAVAMYHLMLDRKVAEELAEMKKNLAAAAAVSSPRNQAPKIQPKQVPKLNIIGKKPVVAFGSPLRASGALAAIVEEDAKEISPDEWNKIEQSESDESLPEAHELRHAAHSQSEIQTKPNYHHKHDSPSHQHDSSSQHRGQSNQHIVRPHEVDQHLSGRAQLSSSAPGLFPPDRTRHRRNSAIEDSSNRSPNNINNRQPNQRRDTHPTPLPTGIQAQPGRGRRLSLDSRAQADLQGTQMSQEHGGGGAQGQQPAQSSPGAPRLVKGVFKSATTTTRPPAETAKLVKKVLSNNEAFFVRRRSPYVFECFEEETGVKFQLEVCKILQANMNVTGVHLKRLEGDIWAYKNTCTSVVNKLCL